MSLEIHRKKPARQGNVSPASSTQVAVSGVQQQQGGGQLVTSQQPERDASKEFYLPGENELGLLEVFHRTRSLAKGNTSDDGVPVCSRPVDELQLNFYDFEGSRVDLNNRLVLKGKMGVMAEHLTEVDDAAVISGRDFKGLAGGLNGLVDAEYMIVTYRDYSPWAVRHFPSEAAGSWLNPFSRANARYVKRYFAIKLGTHPGVFHPITESQFLVGCNKLHLRRSDSSAGGYSPFEALSQEQYNTICNIRHPDEFPMPEPGAAPTGAQDNMFGFVSPQKGSMLDWVIGYTPLGWYRRVRDDAYRALGQALVSLLLFSVGGYILYSYLIKPFVGGGEKDRRSSTRRLRSRAPRDDGYSLDAMSSPLGFAKSQLKQGFDTILGA